MLVAVVIGTVLEAVNGIGPADIAIPVASIFVDLAVVGLLPVSSIALCVSRRLSVPSVVSNGELDGSPG